VASLEVRELTRRYSDTVTVGPVSFVAREREFLSLLGPSGCGKTTTLRCIAGLETADEGAIALGERTVFDATGRVNLAPNKRDLGMVFQSYALWPHMTVRKNIGYPLRTRRIKGDQAKQWIEDVARLVDTLNLLDRYPSQLSGGQQQRVALSRGLVARPELVLFDEPLSNLDARLRDLVRSEIHELHGRLGFTAVYVTHDQAEALALGDRLAIMRAGALEQLATPEQIFEEPATDYVAAFIGMANRMMLEKHDDGWAHDGEPVAGLTIDSDTQTLTLRSRMDDVYLAPTDKPEPPHAIAFKGAVIDSEFGGRHMDVALTIGATRVLSRIPAGARGSWARTLEPGQQVMAYVQMHNLKAFDAGGKLVRGVHHRVTAQV
jgi:iron(III) transport system ATP-binding protein